MSVSIKSQHKKIHQFTGKLYCDDALIRSFHRCWGTGSVNVPVCDRELTKSKELFDHAKICIQNYAGVIRVQPFISGAARSSSGSS